MNRKKQLEAWLCAEKNRLAWLMNRIVPGDDRDQFLHLETFWLGDVERSYLPKGLFDMAAFTLTMVHNKLVQKVDAVGIRNPAVVFYGR